MGSALSCISPAPNATKSSTHEAAPSVPAAADPEAKSELPSNASNAAVKPVAIKDAQATAIGAENAAAQMQPTGTPPATKSDASPHAGATTTARDLPTAVESVFNIEGGGKLTDFAGVKSTGTEPALFAHAPIVMTSLPLSTCPADGTGGSPVGTSNTVGFVNASNVTSAVPVPTQTQLDPHKKPPTPAADAGGASFSSTADSPGLGTSPFPTQTQLDPHKKPPAPSADAGGASFSATVAGAGTSPFPTQTQLDPHKKPPTPAADAGGASFSATVAGAGAGCSRAKAGPSFGAIDLDTVVSTTSTSVQQSGTFADTANVSASIGGGDGDASGIGSSTTHTYTSPFTDTANASASIGGGGGDASGIGSSTAPTCTSPLTPAAGSEHNVEPDVSATAQPNASATAQPDVSATAQPDVSATTQTVVSATAEPNASATAQPDVLATAQPDVSATAQPDVSATAKPDVSATAQPDVLATAQPHVLASAQPDVSATAQPDVSATARPDVSATAQPDVSATAKPDVSATAQPDVSATAQPDVSATAQPDVSATAQPDVSATAQPDVSATAKPDVSATAQPDVSATAKPDVSATAQPDVSATAQPDVSATAQPDVSAAATYTTSSAPIPIARQANFSTGPPPAPIPMAKQADFSTGPPAAPIPTAKEVDISTGTPIRSGATTNPYGGHNSTGSCNSGCVSSEGWSSMLSPAVNAEATGARGGDADATGARGGDAEDTGARGGDAEATGARGGDAEATGARGGDAEATGASGADAEASGARGGDAEANGASGADAEASGARGGDADATGASGANAEACGASGANAEACGASGNDTAPSGAAAAVETASEGRKEKMVTADSAFAGQVQEEGKVHAAASPKGSGHAQGPSKASSMFPFFSARRIRKRGIPLPSITQIFGNMSSVFASFGAITVADVSFGLKVIQSRHHKTKPPSFKAEPESSHMAGARVVGPREALNILDDLDLASGAYKTSAKAMCAATRLKLQNIKFWSSNGSFIRPAMYIAVCHIKNELIVGVRGTKAFLDLVINMCGAPHETPLGHTHWGMHQAAEVLLNDHVDLLEELARGEAKGYTLKFVGHSLGAGVAALMAFIVLNKPELKDRVVGEDAVCGIVATCFAPPSVTDPNLSESLKEVVTSVVMDQDIVPRISCRTMANLVSELAVLRKDWTPEGQTEEDSKNAEDRITEARMHQVSSWSTFPGMITQLHVPAVAVMPNLAEVNPTFKKFQQVMQPLHEVASYLLSSDLVQRWCRVFSRQVGAKKEIPSLNVDGASIQEEQGGGSFGGGGGDREEKEEGSSSAVRVGQGGGLGMKPAFSQSMTGLCGSSKFSQFAVGTGGSFINSPSAGAGRGPSVLGSFMNSHGVGGGRGPSVVGSFMNSHGVGGGRGPSVVGSFMNSNGVGGGRGMSVVGGQWSQFQGGLDVQSRRSQLFMSAVGAAALKKLAEHGGGENRGRGNRVGGAEVDGKGGQGEGARRNMSMFSTKVLASSPFGAAVLAKFSEPGGSDSGGREDRGAEVDGNDDQFEEGMDVRSKQSGLFLSEFGNAALRKFSAMSRGSENGRDGNGCSENGGMEVDGKGALAKLHEEKGSENGRDGNGCSENGGMEVVGKAAHTKLPKERGREIGGGELEDPKVNGRRGQGEEARHSIEVPAKHSELPSSAFGAASLSRFSESRGSGDGGRENGGTEADGNGGQGEGGAGSIEVPARVSPAGAPSLKTVFEDRGITENGGPEFAGLDSQGDDSASVMDVAFGGEDCGPAPRNEIERGRTEQEDGCGSPPLLDEGGCTMSRKVSGQAVLKQMETMMLPTRKEVDMEELGAFGLEEIEKLICLEEKVALGGEGDDDNQAGGEEGAKPKAKEAPGSRIAAIRKIVMSPPGRLVFIHRTQADGVSPDEASHSQAGGEGGPGGVAPETGAAKKPKKRFCVVAYETAAVFDTRIVLGPLSLKDHRMCTYRQGLMNFMQGDWSTPIVQDDNSDVEDGIDLMDT